jgi:very-short-patch-repair endonuclease
MRLDDQIEALATRQHSLVAVWQLHGMGALSKEITRLRQDHRRWSTLTPRVLTLRGVAESDDRRLMAAVLHASPGAVLSHGAAAHLWGAPGWKPAPSDVTRHRGVARLGSPFGPVHEVIDLRPHHVKLVHGIPVTSPGRTVFDLAARSHPARVERLLDWLWSERLLDGTAIDSTVAELARRGRSGSAVMRELAEARGPSYVPPASGLERRFAQLLAERGLPPMRRQVDSGGEEWAGRVDFRSVELPLVVEVQSERHHTSLVDATADARRRQQLVAAGFELVEVWDTEVWHEPAIVESRVRQAERRVRERFRPTG